MARTHITLANLFDDIAEAIREVDGSVANIVADTFPQRIRDAFKSLWKYPTILGDVMQLEQSYEATKEGDTLEIE